MPLPGPTLPHDMAVTEHYTILHDFPMRPDPQALAQGRYKIRFHNDQPSRFGVLPRYGQASDIRWFEAKPTYMLHVVNAWEDGDEVVMVGTSPMLPLCGRGVSGCAGGGGATGANRPRGSSGHQLLVSGQNAGCHLAS